MLVEDEKDKELLELAFIPVTHFLCSIAISFSRLVPTPLQRHFERVGLAILCRIKGRTIDYFMVSPQIFLRLLVLPRIHLMQFSFILTTLRAPTFRKRADTRTYACSTGTCSVCRYKRMFYSFTLLSSPLPLLACAWKQFFSLDYHSLASLKQDGCGQFLSPWISRNFLSSSFSLSHAR